MRLKWSPNFKQGKYPGLQMFSVSVTFLGRKVDQNPYIQRIYATRRLLIELYGVILPSSPKGHKS